MTVPSPVVASDDLTALSNTVTLDASTPYLDAEMSETATHSPAATARQWKLGGTAITGATAATESLRFIGPDGAKQITCTVTNPDGSGTSSNYTVTVQDDLAEDATNELTALSATTLPRSSVNLPWEWHDGLTATPGLPTAQKLYCAQQYGSVLPSADRPTVVATP